MRRSSYTVDFKLSVVEWVKSNDKSISAASRQFGVPRKCVREWLKERDLLSSARVLHGPKKRKLHGGRCPFSEEVDSLVFSFYQEQRKLGRSVGDNELRTRALQVSQLLGYTDFKASTSWLKGWKHRNVFPFGGGVSDRDVVSLSSGQPTSSSLISHICNTDVVCAALDTPWKTVIRDSDDVSAEPSQVDAQISSVSQVLDGKTKSVFTPDHTYCACPSEEREKEEVTSMNIGHLFSAHPPPSPYTSHLPLPPSSSPYPSHSESNSLLVSRTYKDFFDSSLRDMYPPQPLILDTLPPTHYTVQRSYVPSSDPVMGCTLVEDMCELDVPLELEEVIITADKNYTAFTSLPPSSSSSSLSQSSSSSFSASSVITLTSPRRSSPAKLSKLWPMLSCNRMSPTALCTGGYPELPDPLTGLLANRLSQPVFPDGPKILCWDVSSAAFAPNDP